MSVASSSQLAENNVAAELQNVVNGANQRSAVLDSTRQTIQDLAKWKK
jgi:hypothetical protein